MPTLIAMPPSLGAGPRIARPQLLLVSVFFLVTVFIGVAAHADYGIPADEPAMRTAGIQAYGYLFAGTIPPQTYDWKFHNLLFQALLVGAEQKLGLTEAADIWGMRHMLTHMLYICGIAAFFVLAKKVLQDWRWALLGCVFFVLSPRLFAQSFYNPKDIPSLALFTVSMATLYCYRDSGYRWRWLLPHAIACGLIISFRVFGLLVPLFTVLLLVIDTVTSTETPKAKLRFSVPRILALIPAVGFALILVWPLLWHHPVSHFLGAFFDNTERTGAGVYMGRYVEGFPWHYLPIWIAITTPLLYVFLFFAGITDVFVKGIRTWKTVLVREAAWLPILLWLLLPYAALVILHVGIFDEWRHVLFLYPAVLLLALRGARALWMLPSRWAPRAVIAMIVIGLCQTSYWMMTRHPYEYAYFSIPGAWAEGNFELDYWNLSYLPALQWVVAHDQRPSITVYTAAREGAVSADLLPDADWKRVHFTDADHADYILDNFRWNRYKPSLPDSFLLHVISVDGIRLLGIYQGPAPSGIFPSHEEAAAG